MYAAVFKFQVFNSISTIPHLADMSSAPPKQLATPEDTFSALAVQFNFDTRIKDKIIELGIRTLAEFRHNPRTDEEVKKLFVDSLTPTLDDIPARLQAARLRFAWNSCKAMLDAEHAAASLPPASTEEETLLPTSELDSLKEAFYKRYHIRPEPRQFPSDRLLSKLSRQLYRGQWEVMDLWTVRPLTQASQGGRWPIPTGGRHRGGYVQDLAGLPDEARDLPVGSGYRGLSAPGFSSNGSGILVLGQFGLCAGAL